MKQRTVKRCKPVRRNCTNLDDPEFSRRPKDGCGFIYAYHFARSGKSYIGQTRRTIRQRLKDHTTKAMEVDRMIMSGARFTIEILCETKKEYLDAAETYCISKFGTFFPNGYNMTRGGLNIWSSDDSLNRRLCQKMKEAYSNDPDIVRRRGEYMRRYYAQVAPASSKSVMCLEDGKIYRSFQTAADAIGLKNQTSIRMAAHLHKCTTAGGLHWAETDIALGVREELLNIIKDFEADLHRMRVRRARENGRSNSKPVVYNGVKYPSYGEVSRRFNIPKTTLRRMISRGSGILCS